MPQLMAKEVRLKHRKPLPSVDEAIEYVLNHPNHERITPKKLICERYGLSKTEAENLISKAIREGKWISVMKAAGYRTHDRRKISNYSILRQAKRMAKQGIYPTKKDLARHFNVSEKKIDGIVSKIDFWPYDIEFAEDWKLEESKRLGDIVTSCQVFEMLTTPQEAEETDDEIDSLDQVVLRFLTESPEERDQFIINECGLEVVA